MNKHLPPETIKQLQDLVDQGSFPSLQEAAKFCVEVGNQLHFLAEKEAVDRGIAAADAGNFYEGDMDTLLEEIKQRRRQEK